MGGRSRAPAPVAAPAVVKPAPTVVETTPEGGFAKQFITNASPSTSGEGIPDNQRDYRQDTGSNTAIPGMGDDDMAMGDGGNQFISAPFEQRGATSYLGSTYDEAGTNLPSMDLVVPNQNPQATGEGGENFGSRLTGSEAGTVGMPDPSGTIPQTNEISIQNQGDVATTDEQPLPGQQIDYEGEEGMYRMAAYGSPNGGGFVPGDRGAMGRATNAMSRNLSNAGYSNTKRGGFGRRLNG